MSKTTIYTVSFLDSNTHRYEVSRYFNTVRAAKNWAKWLRSTKFVAETSVYLGQAGAELIERKAA